MKKLILLFIALLFVGSAQANYYGVVARKNAGCTIGSPDATGKYETVDGTLDLYNWNARGQSFQIGTAGDLARICVDITHVADDTVEIRIDDDLDLGVSPIEDLGESATVTADGWVCIDSVTQPSLSTGTTYYLAVRLGTTNSNLSWDYGDADASYASGVRYNLGSEWVLNTNASTDDHAFRIYLCQ